MTACPGPETLALLLREQLGLPLREQVESHIEGCTSCQELLDLLSSEITPLPIPHPGRGPAPAEFLPSASFLGRIGPPGAFRLPPPEPGSDWPKIEGYEILGELGSGGMGRVYRAKHLGLSRQVALKVIRPGPSSELLRSRLEQEAMALARLRHPNIVQVYDVGISEGQAYLSLELIEGTTLASWLNGLPQPPEIAAHLAWVLAQGVDYAHRNGILHRDLKPSNILVESSPECPLDPEAKPAPPRIKITDFGLAKAIAEGDPLAGGLTATGDLVGTPQYMAPEQGSGLRGSIGLGADVYALGVILYELLTGRPPFRAATPLKTILQVVHEPPPNLSRLRPRIPTDLATICMKCLEKAASSRYHSAGALAEDLRRFLAREPITARPVGPAGRLVRWARRKPLFAAMAGTTIAVTALAFGLVVWQWRDAVAARTRAERARLESGRVAVGLLFDEALAACTRGDVPIGLEGFARTQREAEALGQGALAEACRANIACWSGRVSTISASPPLDTVVAIAVDPDCRRILAIHRPGAGEGGGPAFARLWDSEGWMPIGPPLKHGGPVTAIAFSPDGGLALTGAADGSVRAWDAATGEPAGPILRELGSVSSVAFHPDGRRFAAGGGAPGGGGRGEVRIWDAPGRGRTIASRAFDGPVDAIAFSPDGALLATSSRLPETADASPLAEVCQWDTSLEEREGPRLMHADPIRVLAYSPDGKRLASGGDRRVVTLWDRETGKQAGPPLAQPGATRSIAFTPDGETLAVAGGGPAEGEEGPKHGRVALRFWDVDSGRAHDRLITEDMVRAFAIGRGRRAAAAGVDGRISIHELGINRPKEQALPFPCALLAYSPGGNLLFAAGGDRGSDAGRVQALDPATGEPLRPSAALPAKAAAIAITRKEGIYALALEDGTVRAYDAQTDRPIGPPLRLPARADSLAFSENGERLLAVAPGSAARLWDWRSGELAWSSPPGDAPRAAALAPDGLMVLVAHGGAGLALWDLASGAYPKELGGVNPKRFLSVEFSPNRSLAVAGDDQGTARCWELATGRVTGAAFKSAGRPVARVGFAGEGTLAYAVEGHAALDAGFIYAWDPASGAPPQQIQYRIKTGAVTFGAGHRLIVTGGWSGGIRLWDAATGHRIGPELPDAGNSVAIACSPDGRLVASADERDTLRIWRIPLPMPRPPAE